jgi:Na+-translocating ferredoxin:NAD+ oxidoreductase subunit G
MAKLESTLKNMILSLFGVTFIASALLGYVHELTEAPIEQAKKAREAKAIYQVVPVDSSVLNTIEIKKETRYILKSTNEILSKKDIKEKNPGQIDSLMIYYVSAQGKKIGTAVKSFTDKGFNGKIKLMAGFDSNGELNNVKVLEHAETPGLGTKMTEKDFKKQFKGIDPASFTFEVKKDGGDVDAITAATISTRAYCDAVKRAWKVYKSQQ